jgi:hypothetical protein
MPLQDGYVRSAYSLRLDRAAHLLSRRSGKAQPLSEIAYACGFGDYTHFARKFRRRHNRPHGGQIAYIGAVDDQSAIGELSEQVVCRQMMFRRERDDTGSLENGQSIANINDGIGVLGGGRGEGNVEWPKPDDLARDVAKTRSRSGLAACYDNVIRQAAPRRSDGTSSASPSVRSQAATRRRREGHSFSMRRR